MGLLWSLSASMAFAYQLNLVSLADEAFFEVFVWVGLIRLTKKGTRRRQEPGGLE
jgi:hypothetical protein